MSPPTNCPVCGKDLSTFTPQKAYGHIGGHKRRKSHQTEPNAQPNAQKAVFEVSEETPKKLEKIDVTKTKPPAEAKVAEAATEGLQDIVKLFAELYNEYATGKPVDYSITTEDGARVSRAVVLLDSKYHFGVEAATGYFPEIFAAIVIGAICFKIYIGIVSKKGRGRTRTAEQLARAEEPATQSTDALSTAYEIFERPEVKAGIEEAFKTARGEV